MAEFYCSECDIKILQKVYRGYDRTFCSEFCRNRITNWYTYNHNCELERKNKSGVNEELICKKLKQVSFSKEKDNKEATLYKNETIINNNIMNEVEELTLRSVFNYIYDSTKTYLIYSV